MSSPERKRPPLPKRLAARIVAAQQILKSARSLLINNEQRIASNLNRIAEYETDPVLFSQTYYQGRDIGSYPIQTNIGRAREDVEFRVERRTKRADEIRIAEHQLQLVEFQVAEEVEKLRSHKNRVPWPDDVPPFDTYRDIANADWARVQQEAETERAVYLERVEREYQVAIEQSEAESAKDREELTKAMESWSPEKRASWKEIMNLYVVGLREGKTVQETSDDITRISERLRT